MRMQAPPAALIFCSANFEKYLADDNRYGDLTVAQQLEVTLRDQVDDWSFVSSVLGCFIDTFSCGIENFIEIDGRTEFSVLQKVELTHTDLTEITRMVLIHKGTVVMLSSSITATTRMLTVLSDTTVTGGDVSPLLAVLG